LTIIKLIPLSYLSKMEKQTVSAIYPIVSQHRKMNVFLYFQIYFCLVMIMCILDPVPHPPAGLRPICSSRMIFDNSISNKFTFVTSICFAGDRLAVQGQKDRAEREKSSGGDTSLIFSKAQLGEFLKPLYKEEGLSSFLNSPSPWHFSSPVINRRGSVRVYWLGSHCSLLSHHPRVCPE
jgi:hypothetical protein